VTACLPAVLTLTLTHTAVSRLTLTPTPSRLTPFSHWPGQAKLPSINSTLSPRLIVHASTCSPIDTLFHLRHCLRASSSSSSSSPDLPTPTLLCNPFKIRLVHSTTITTPILLYPSCLTCNPIASWPGTFHRQDEGRSAACRLARGECSHILRPLRTARQRTPSNRRR
jgi:hypothetical protein